MGLNRVEALEQLKFLWDQVHQTAERIEHMPVSMPLGVHADSLNYEKDLTRFQGEYNRLAQTAQSAGLLSAQEIQAEGLPHRFERERL